MNEKNHANRNKWSNKNKTSWKIKDLCFSCRLYTACNDDVSLNTKSCTSNNIDNNENAFCIIGTSVFV